MLLQTIEALFRKYRLFCYQKLFSAVREKPGSLSATEAFSADIIHLLEVRQFPSLPIPSGSLSQMQPIRSINLCQKGYLRKTVQAHDRREIVLTTSEKFSGYFDENEEEMQKKSLRSPRSLHPKNFAAPNACCWPSERFCNEGGYYGHF